MSYGSVAIVTTVATEEIVALPYCFLNPFTPRSDKHVTSPYNIQTLSSKQEMGI